jgi:hypothetical protein
MICNDGWNAMYKLKERGQQHFDDNSEKVKVAVWRTKYALMLFRMKE